ncbi:MAG TPA: saccharopine dehydrogenase family protein [Anaerohalosphaeraceae bacterium]|nr:saccharopine dehydrogenase family protein [Phycisphaerae bacterium]HOK95764.1 saccharopine dehydrogenase family protein [Anaerohalosphaeraceae bacterium]HOL30464.1 saccharopine dehydrogenase family protein [Anaerohalosphaeraceae bacterium]HOM76664.1 saccharopine dehydrogenase family protein [Anaerohalosphaeraceae bacterium]HPC64067.1 saccharopine dehydrogenase family protein [Anaerohalosphaeraceae bacterium]
MSKVLIIGAGGVGNVVVHKCAQQPDVFSQIVLASRTKAKCDKIAAALKRPITTEQVDADSVPQIIALIHKHRPDIVINTALPYQDLPIMDACLDTKTDYLDTANYEPKDEAKFEYKWQWAYHDRYQKAGIMALLGSGFDPGVTNVFCAYAQKHFYDEIHTVDIVDCNAGQHGHPFATNFNPEINIREITQKGKYWENGRWIEIEPMSVSMDIDYPEVGPKRSYLLYHEELESLVKHMKGLRRIRFWMTFGQAYLTHLQVLQNVGMTSIKPIDFKGQKIVPLEFLKAVLPDPGSLGTTYSGKTCIGCIFDGVKDGKQKQMMIYNVCDHAECFKETGSQAISYTTGVPAMIGAKMMLTGKWKRPGVWNLEQFDPDPFMDDLNRCGLPWKVLDGKTLEG